MKFLGKYKIVTGITTQYKINPQNPKYFAKYINDNIMCLGNTETEAIENLKNLYIEYKRKNKLHSPLSEKVLNSCVLTEKSEKYIGIAHNFFDFIGKDPDTQINDEFTVSDFDIEDIMLEKLKLEYKIDIKQEDLLVAVFEKIEKSCA